MKKFEVTLGLHLCEVMLVIHKSKLAKDLMDSTKEGLLQYIPDRWAWLDTILTKINNTLQTFSNFL